MTITTVYVAGPLSAAREFLVERNRRSAEAFAAELWQAGFVPVVPHMLTRPYGGLVEEELFVRGVLYLMLQCDAVILMPNWLESAGTRAEARAALDAAKPIFDDARFLLASGAPRWPFTCAGDVRRQLEAFEVEQAARRTVGK